jgi:glycosyltransferase involved in cell wall biosynthesis
VNAFLPASGEDLRLLFITGEYPPLPGGVGDYAFRLREALEALGVRTSVLTLDGGHGARVHTTRRWGWRTDYTRVVHAERPSVAHIQYQAGAFAMHLSINLLPRRLARDFQLPTVTTFHDLRPPYLFPKAGQLRDTAMRLLATRSAAVVVTNHDDERALLRRGVHAVQIPIGANLPPPSVCLADRDALEVAFFGFPGRSKGVADLVAALGHLDAARRPTLTLVGAHGSPSQHNDHLSDTQLDALAARAGVRLHRTGFLSPQGASDTLAQARVIVLPFRDGASLRNGSLLAALQTGRPVISTTPCTPEALGSLGQLPQLTLAPPRAPLALATAIESALAHETCSAALPAEYRWEAIARRHVALYRMLLERRRARP